MQPSYGDGTTVYPAAAAGIYHKTDVVADFAPL